MTFIPVTIRPQALESRSIVLINDHPDANAYAANRKIDRASEGVLEQALHMAGLTKSDIVIANLFPDRISTKDLWNDKGKFLHPAARPYTDALLDLLGRAQPKIVIPLGPISCKALLNRADYTSIRGYPFPTDSYIILPTLHPRDMIWGNYIWRFYLSHDLSKAKRLAEGNEQIHMPNLFIAQTFGEAIAILEKVAQAKKLSIDIEVSNYEVSCIGFSFNSNTGFSIPFDQRWSDQEELTLWLKIAEILGNPAISKIFQNGIFDVYFLLYKMHIFTEGWIDDTMIAHSVVYPDFLKGLEFLGSVYTTLTYWKDEADFKKPLKDEA